MWPKAQILASFHHSAMENRLCCAEYQNLNIPLLLGNNVWNATRHATCEHLISIPRLRRVLLPKSLAQRYSFAFRQLFGNGSILCYFDSLFPIIDTKTRNVLIASWRHHVANMWMWRNWLELTEVWSGTFHLKYSHFQPRFERAIMLRSRQLGIWIFPHLLLRINFWNATRSRMRNVC